MPQQTPPRPRRNTTKLVVFALFLLIIALASLALSGQPLDVSGLQAGLATLETWRAEQPVVFAVVFFASYIAIAALSLPLSTWMTLAAGALFGFGWGLLIVSFASSIGATLAFLAARFLLRDMVTARLGARAQTVADGMERDGGFYLFTLRMVPAVPFFIVNLAMGLTKITVPTFYLVSQVGMLAGTAVYINAGTHLGQLQSLSGILSPALLVSFALLGAFPWLARLAITSFKRQRVYARWQKPARFDRNLIVIGAGAAGLVSAYIGAAVKAKVTLIEGHKMGGDCLNYGCVPSKALIKSARLAHQIRHGEDFGLEAGAPTVSFRKVMARVHRVIADIAPHDSVERYQSLGVEVLTGQARLIDPWTVEISDANGAVQRLSTRAIIIATGAAPFVPPLPGLDAVGHLTSDTLWEKLAAQDSAPKRLVVLGGGPIGCELSQAFARLGSDVTLVEMAPRLLLREDPEVAELVQAALHADGVQVLTGHKALGCGVRDGEKWINVSIGDETRRIAFDEIIVAVGRSPRLAGFGLEELGIPVKRVVETNEYLETLYPNIFAAGDVAGPYQFTHAAAHQAWFATVNALFGRFWRVRAEYRVMPWAVFVDPELARLGLNEQDAQTQGIAYEVTRYDIDDLDRAIADGTARGFVKVLTTPGRDRILGVTIMGEHAADLMAEFVLAMKHGLGLNKILSTIHIYPTLAEANKYAAGAWKRSHVNALALRLLERFHLWQRG